MARRSLFEAMRINGREMLVAALAMLLASTALTAWQYRELDDRFRADLQTQADIVGQNTSAALVFDAPADGEQVLSALASAPQVEFAEVRRRDGSVLAQYRRASPANAHFLHGFGEGVSIGQAVTLNGHVLGTLRVEGDRDTVLIDALQFWAGGMGIIAVALGLSWFASSRLRAGMRAAQARTSYLAHHDALTGLSNRTHLLAKLEKAAAAAMDHGAEVAVLFIDLDNFKEVNDLHGHAAGDAVLCAVSERLRASVRPDDLVARMGGDEFGLLLRAQRGGGAARRVALEVVDRLRQPIAFEGLSLRVSVSVGVALVPNDATEAAAALQCADVAMHHAKHEGKNGYRFYTADLAQEIRTRSELEADMRVGLSEGQFELWYQPIWDAQGRMVCMEALMRWRHPARGMVSPADFIPLAEHNGLIVDLGLAALRRVRADLDTWKAAGCTVPRVALNIASNQFRREEHRRQFMETLQACGLTPDEVEFELTESTAFEGISSPDSPLGQLRAQGYALAIDDFGTGYSSLSYLRRLKCQKLKIDQSFVRDVHVADESALLVRAIIDVAHALGMSVVAEGVETARERELLVSLSCDSLQGYLLARPMPPGEVSALLRLNPAAASAPGAALRRVV